MKLDLSLYGGEYNVRLGENTIFAYPQNLRKKLVDLGVVISGEIDLPRDMVRTINNENSYPDSRFETGVKIKLLGNKSMELSTYVDQAEIDKKLAETEELLNENSIILPRYTVNEGVRNGFMKKYATTVSLFKPLEGLINAVGEADLDALNIEQLGEKIGEIRQTPIGYLSNNISRKHYNSRDRFNNFQDTASIVIPSLSFYYHFIGNLGENNQGKQRKYPLEHCLNESLLDGHDDDIPF
jgi:hypothetical protein